MREKLHVTSNAISYSYWQFVWSCPMLAPHVGREDSTFTFFFQTTVAAKVSHPRLQGSWYCIPSSFSCYSPDTMRVNTSFWKDFLFFFCLFLPPPLFEGQISLSISLFKCITLREDLHAVVLIFYPYACIDILVTGCSHLPSRDRLSPLERCLSDYHSWFSFAIVLFKFSMFLFLSLLQCSGATASPAVHLPASAWTFTSCWASYSDSVWSLSNTLFGELTFPYRFLAVHVLAS